MGEVKRESLSAPVLRRCPGHTRSHPPLPPRKGSVCTLMNRERPFARPSVSPCHSTFLPTQTDGRSVGAKGTQLVCVRACAGKGAGLPSTPGTQTPLPRPTANGRTTSDGPVAEEAAARVGLGQQERGRGRYRVAWLLMQQAVKLPRPPDAPFLPVSNFRP